MDEKMKDEQAPAPKKKGMRAIWNITAALLLGALGNGVWEALVRPGFGWAGQVMNSIASRFDSEVFSSAALDPTPLPGLALLMLACTAPFAIAGLVMGFSFEFAPLEKLLGRARESLEVSSGKERARRTILKLAAGVLTAAMLTLGTVALVAFSIQNKATIVWRVFNANLDVATPYMTDDERKQLFSRFRAMSSKEEFTQLQKELDTTVEKHGKRLTWWGL